MAGVPYTFGSATTSIPLSQLDSNFTTPVTIGSTTVALGNTVTSLAGLTSVTTTGDSSISGLTVGKGGGAVSTNTAVGASALQANTTGLENVAVGYQSSYSNTTGFDNTAIGYTALYSNQTGRSSCAYGVRALYTSTVSDNAAFGVEALYSNTTGLYNFASGPRDAAGNAPMYSNTTGSNNIGIGAGALKSNTTASNNTAVGYQAGYSKTTGDSNTFLGNVSGYSATTGVQNTFAGYYSGYLITTGSKNAILGSYSGNGGGLDIRTASNYIVLSDGDGNPRLASDGSGNVSIGVFGKSNKFAVEQGSTSTATGLISNNRNVSGDYALTLALGANCNDTSSVMLHCTQPGTRNVAFIYGNGNLANQNNSYGSSSDIKLKENIADATPKLEDLCKVKIRNYNLKNDPDHKQIGVIAQELETVFPSLIDETPDLDTYGNKLETTTKSVKYSVFVPMLIKGLQELKTIIDAQATEIAELKAKVA